MKEYFKKWRYLGFEPKEMNRTADKMYGINLEMMKYISLTAALLLIPTSLYPLVILHNPTEAMVHYLCALLMLLFCGCADTMRKRRGFARMRMVYPGILLLYMHIFAAFGIYDSIYTNTNQLSVSFFLLVMCLQFAFVISPVLNMQILVLDSIVFLFCSYAVKPWEVFLVDAIYCCITFILSSVTGWLIAHLRVKHMITEEKLSILNERLYERSITDMLTGLHNRRKFTEEAAKRILKRSPEEEYVATMVFDIDFFKQYNDFYGHDQGDIALYEVAQLLLRFRKHYNFSLCRWGGEEFMVLFLTDSPDFAVRIANEMCRAVHDLHLQNEASAISPYLTISVGLYLSASDPDSNWNDLYRKADQALYMAKKRGRNSVCVINETYPVQV